MCGKGREGVGRLLIEGGEGGSGTEEIRKG